jgi:hypothetical protein
MQLGFMIHIPQQTAPVYSGGLIFFVYRHPPHHRQVNHKSTIADRGPSRVVAAALHGNFKIVLTGKIHCPYDIACADK